MLCHAYTPDPRRRPRTRDQHSFSRPAASAYPERSPMFSFCNGHTKEIPNAQHCPDGSLSNRPTGRPLRPPHRAARSGSASPGARRCSSPRPSVQSKRGAIAKESRRPGNSFASPEVVSRRGAGRDAATHSPSPLRCAAILQAWRLATNAQVSCARRIYQVRTTEVEGERSLSIDLWSAAPLAAVPSRSALERGSARFCSECRHSVSGCCRSWPRSGSSSPANRRSTKSRTASPASTRQIQ